MIQLHELQEFLRYDPDTGHFWWRKRPSAKVSLDHPAGCLKKTGYIDIGFRGHYFRAHRLAWLFVVGAWPDHDIDHINGVKTDNRISNLRLATTSQNHQNQKQRSDNTSGYKGVWFDRRGKSWRAALRINGKLRHLGSFATAEAAGTAYEHASKLHFGDFARFR